MTNRIARAGVRLRDRLREARIRTEAGMSTAEYAVGTLAAVAFAAVLIGVVKSGAVKASLTSIITSALSVAG